MDLFFGPVTDLLLDHGNAHLACWHLIERLKMGDKWMSLKKLGPWLVLEGFPEQYLHVVYMVLAILYPNL